MMGEAPKHPGISEKRGRERAFSKEDAIREQSIRNIGTSSALLYVLQQWADTEPQRVFPVSVVTEDGGVVAQTMEIRDVLEAVRIFFEDNARRSSALSVITTEFGIKRKCMALLEQEQSAAYGRARDMEDLIELLRSMQYLSISPHAQNFVDVTTGVEREGVSLPYELRPAQHVITAISKLRKGNDFAAWKKMFEEELPIVGARWNVSLRTIVSTLLLSEYQEERRQLDISLGGIGQ